MSQRSELLPLEVGADHPELPTKLDGHSEPFSTDTAMSLI